jgi:hypothetical protein
MGRIRVQDVPRRERMRCGGHDEHLTPRPHWCVLRVYVLGERTALSDGAAAAVGRAACGPDRPPRLPRLLCRDRRG